MADLSLQLQADNLPAEALEQLLVEGHWKAVLNRLRSGENLLLEGCRGVGKTMLMRASAERLGEEARKGGKVLGVHAQFLRYLTTIPPPGSPDSGDLGTFKAWVNARILRAVRERIARTWGDEGLARAGRVAKVDWAMLVSVLETTYKGTASSAAAADAGLSAAELQGLQGYTYASDLLQEVRVNLGLDLLVLLLDDAAHALDTRAQGAFFTLVKSLYAPGLAFKISVYPAVTRYGMDFSYGHDATVVSLVEVPGPASMGPLIEMLRARARLPGSGSDSGALIDRLLQQHEEWVRLIIYCANGNPRGVLNILATVLAHVSEPDRVSYEDIRGAINAVTDRHLGMMIPGVLKDLDPRLLKAAEELLARLREKIADSPSSSSGEPKMFLAISNSPQIPYLCAAATRLLVSANVLTYAGPQRLSNRENGSSYLLHPGYVFRQNVLGGSVAVDRWLQHFDGMSPKVHAELSKAAPVWQEVKEAAMEEPSARCLNGHAMMDGSAKCEACGAVASARGPVAILLEKPLDALSLSDAIKARLRNAGLTTVGKVFEASDSQLDEIEYIGDARIREIRSAVAAAVDEYFAG